MSKQETTVNETTSETLPDEVAESQIEEDKDCVEAASSAEAEETDKQQLDLFSSTDDVDETDPEMDSPDENDLPESENLTTPDDGSVESSTENVEETDPEMDSPDENDLPESENLTTPDDGSVESSTENVEETDPEIDSPDENDLPESENLTTPDDGSVESSDNVGETEPETDSSDENDLPESENLTTPDDEHAQPEQNTLEEMNKTLSDVRQLLNQSVVQSAAQTEIFQSTQGLSTTSLAELKELFETHISRNVNQNTMFDKMYREMEGYKEIFLLEALHKPVIHNLIQFYDAFAELQSQFEDILGKGDIVEPEGLSQELQSFQTNLEDIRFELEEVLYRMDVTLYEEQQKMFDKKLHKTIQVIPTDEPDKDQKVAEVRKKGFSWRGKVFRPEEVTVYRYEPSEVKSEDETDEHTLNEEGAEIDE